MYTIGIRDWAKEVRDGKTLSDERLVRRRLGRRVSGPCASYDLRQACRDVPPGRWQVAALEDACWHRLVPRRKGRLEGDALVCGYHGLKYNSQGRCTFMPSQETINPSACVRAYPAVERHRFVWLWMGDPALADPARFPTCTGITTRLGRRRQDHSRQLRLPPGGRQSDGPDARDLRARL